MEKPKQIETPDFEALRKVCQDYIDFIDSEDYHEDNDYDHYIHEAAMEAIFGKDIWKYVNSKI